MFSPETLLSLSPSVLRPLLAAVTPSPASAPYALLRALYTSGPTKKLATLLFSPAVRFSSRTGRLALVEAGRAVADPRADTWLAEPSADVAPLLSLALERETSPAKRRGLRRLFALASHRVARDLPERPTYELVPESAEALAALSPAAVTKRLSRAFGSRLLDTWPAADPDGAHRFALFLTQPTENRLVYDESARTRVAQRRDVPVAVDVVRVTPGRVAITTAAPELLADYASALGLSLRPSLTLRPLQSLAPDALALAARAAGLAALEVVGVRYRRPNGKRIEVRGPDALDPADLGPRTGYIDRVTLRATTTDGATVDAFLQLPYRVEIPAGPHAAQLRAALEALTLFAPGSLPDDARSLAPYEHPDWRWRAVLGDAAFARLVALGLLGRAAASHVASREHSMHGAAYLVRDVPGEPGALYALAEDRCLGARIVGAKDRAVWRLDVRALAAAMARDLGATPAAAPLEIAGLLDLGVVSLASGKVRIVYGMAEPAAGWVDAVRRACGLGVTPVVLVPKGHEGEAKGMLEVGLPVDEQLGARRIGRVLGRIAEALDVGDEVERWRRHDEDIVIEAATESAWVTGVRVPFRDRAYGLVLHLARAAGAVVATKEVGASISAAGAPDVTARKARAEAEEAARRAGVDEEIVARMIVVEGRKGYRLGVSARVV